MQDEQKDLEPIEENKVEASTLLAGAAILVLGGHILWALLEYRSGIDLKDCLYTAGKGLVISLGIGILSGIAMYASKKLK
jgi:hypothetical protein